MRERYLHQILFEEIGEEGQARISMGHVCIAGCGALGSMSAMALVRAGAGKVRIIDRDFVEMKNLHRQILYDEADASNIMPKAIAAADKLRRINSSVQVEGIVADLNHLTAEDLLGGCDVIVDGSDNFETRFLINEFAVKRSIPWIYGAARGSYGITFNIIPGEGPCLRCIFESAPQQGSYEACDRSGIIPSVPYIVASIQCVEVLKILSGRRQKLNNFISAIDVWKGVSNQMRLGSKRADCPVCVLHEFKMLEKGEFSSGISRCGRNVVQIQPLKQGARIDLESLRKKSEGTLDIVYNGFLLRIKLAEHEITVFPDGRAFVRGTEDEDLARSLYEHYVGS